MNNKSSIELMSEIVERQKEITERLEKTFDPDLLDLMRGKRSAKLHANQIALPNGDRISLCVKTKAKDDR